MLFLQLDIAYTDSLSDDTARQILFKILDGAGDLRKMFLRSTISFWGTSEKALYTKLAAIMALPEVRAIPAVADFLEEVTSADDFISALGYKLSCSTRGQHSEVLIHCVSLPDVTNLCISPRRNK